MPLYRGRITRLDSETAPSKMWYTVPDIAVGYELGPEPYLNGVEPGDLVLVGQIGEVLEDLEVIEANDHHHDDDYVETKGRIRYYTKRQSNERYYTKAEVNALLAQKADVGHSH